MSFWVYLHPRSLAFVTRSLAPLEPDASCIKPIGSCLSGGRTGDGSCLGPVRPRPLDGPFEPPRAGALAPSFNAGVGYLIAAPASVLRPTHTPYGGWMAFDRQRPKTLTAFPMALVRMIEVSVHLRHPDSTRDAWRRAGKSYWLRHVGRNRPWPRRSINGCMVRSSPLLRCQAPRPACRIYRLSG